MLAHEVAQLDFGELLSRFVVYKRLRSLTPVVVGDGDHGGL
jgi:hypothetical protein